MSASSVKGLISSNLSSISSSIWILDSGVSHHMSYDHKSFASLNLASSVSLLTADGTPMPISVNYVILVIQLFFLPHLVMCRIHNPGERLGHAVDGGELYVLDELEVRDNVASTSIGDLSSFCLNSSSTSFYLWDSRLGHVSAVDTNVNPDANVSLVLTAYQQPLAISNPTSHITPPPPPPPPPLLLVVILHVIELVKYLSLILEAFLCHSSEFSALKFLDMELEKGGENPDNQVEASDRMKMDMAYVTTDYVKAKNKPTPTSEVHSAMKQEILQLERRLQDQFEVRCTLEKALGYRSSLLVNSNEKMVPKPATELIKEIAVLELEVVYLEQHLLSLYRKAFDQKLPSVSPFTKEETIKHSPATPQEPFVKSSMLEVLTKNDHDELENLQMEHSRYEMENLGKEKHLDSGVYRCHSSLSHCTAFTRASPTEESLTKALRACHSQPLSMMEYVESSSSNIISLAEHLDPPMIHPGLSSPISSLSSTSNFSIGDQGDTWSPSTMVEIPWIYKENQKSGDTKKLLQNYKSLISRLEEIDPGNLEHDEKLAFWINIHNALVMHAFLAYGIPQNSMKRVFLLLKAAYNVGGYIVSADTIQNTILRCRMSRPGQWLRLFFSSKTKFKTGDGRQAYALKHLEPLSHFALCSGNHSDPAVRVYAPKRVFQDLEVARDEYIRATLGVRKDQRILLPKLIETFAKDSDLCPSGVMDMILESLPESLRRRVKKCQLARSKKCIEWIPHNFNFRYLISKDVLK
ncbi:unnamed protein product [Vicia faba]|uniref:Electron transporter n=1 Tax=Vicia faba TaxID=3906 RepID=A0AAV0YU64_VICFA|nr:unnamed protein product [Vicia faba]